MIMHETGIKLTFRRIIHQTSFVQAIIHHLSPFLPFVQPRQYHIVGATSYDTSFNRVKARAPLHVEMGES